MTLLLGNHDIHYFDKDINSTRKDKVNYEKIHQIFREDLSLFKLAMTVRTAGRDFLFTHAGVDIGWLRHRMPEVNPNDVHEICKSLNDKLITEESLCEFVFNGLMDVSASRWGYARYPSPVWTDETDHKYMRERLPNVYQIFGHTQHESKPVITEQYACLDCRKAFLLTREGNLIEAETTNKR